MLSNEGLLIVLRQQIILEKDQKTAAIDQRTVRVGLVHDWLFGHLWCKLCRKYQQVMHVSVSFILAADSGIGQRVDSFSLRAGLRSPVLVACFMYCGTCIFTSEKTLWIFFSTRACGGCRMLAWCNGRAKQYRTSGHCEVMWKLRWVPVGSVLCNKLSTLVYMLQEIVSCLCFLCTVGSQDLLRHTLRFHFRPCKCKFLGLVNWKHA
jgi:hypothetical protein